MDRQEFIAAWKAAKSLEDLAAVHGIPPCRATSRASKIRADGVPMKYMTFRPKPLTDAAFASAWNRAEKVADVVDATGMHRDSVLRRVGRVKARGYEMKTLVRPTGSRAAVARQIRSDKHAGSMPDPLKSDVKRDWHTESTGWCTVKCTDRDFLAKLVEKTNAIRSARLGRHGGVHTGNGATNVCAA